MGIHWEREKDGLPTSIRKVVQHSSDQDSPGIHPTRRSGARNFGPRDFQLAISIARSITSHDFASPRIY